PLVRLAALVVPRPGSCVGIVTLAFFPSRKPESPKNPALIAGLSCSALLPAFAKFRRNHCGRRLHLRPGRRRKVMRAVGSTVAVALIASNAAQAGDNVMSVRAGRDVCGAQ